MGFSGHYDGPVFSHRRMPFHGSGLVDTERRGDPPASADPCFRNEFIQQDPAKHEADWKYGPKIAPAYDLPSLITPSGDPHQMSNTYLVLFWKSMYRYTHYNMIREPTFPREPDLTRGELAAGATVTRTSVWHNPNEPAIQSIKKFHPDYFRPVGLATTAPNPTDYGFPGIGDFRDQRLPRGHADRRPWYYFCLAASTMVMGSLIRGFVVKLNYQLWISRDMEALGNVEVDTSQIMPGQNYTTRWRGKPIFIRRRTPEMIAASRADDSHCKSFKDPATDAERCPNPEWLIVLGVCTHLGCIPHADAGMWHGFFCPCHGSHYDHAGRIRAGPAPTNLEIPEYEWVSDTVIKLGTD